MYQVYKPRRGLKRSEDTKVRRGGPPGCPQPRPDGSREPGEGVRDAHKAPPGARSPAGAAGWPCGALTRHRSPQETYKLPHRLIEKKRRDRINECIAQLKDLLPEHLKLTVGAAGTRSPLPSSLLPAAHPGTATPGAHGPRLLLPLLLLLLLLLLLEPPQPPQPRTAPHSPGPGGWRCRGCHSRRGTRFSAPPQALRKSPCGAPTAAPGCLAAACRRVPCTESVPGAAGGQRGSPGHGAGPEPLPQSASPHPLLPTSPSPAAHISFLCCPPPHPLPPTALSHTTHCPFLPPHPLPCSPVTPSLPRRPGHAGSPIRPWVRSRAAAGANLSLCLQTLGHLEKAVVLELTLKHVKALTNLIEQQQQKIIALQNGLQAGE